MPTKPRSTRIPSTARTTVRRKPMPVAKSQPAPTAGPLQTLGAWIWKTPIKFSILATILTVALIIIAVAITSAYAPVSGFGPIEIPLGIRILFFAALVLVPLFSIYKLTRWTPYGNLDRRSFLALTVVTTILSTAVIIIGYCCGLYETGQTPVLPLWFIHLVMSPTLLAIAIIVILVVMTYALGLFLSAKYGAMFWRLRAMGMARWKFWLSFPFGWGILSYPAIFLPEYKKTAPVISIRVSWLSKITDWASTDVWNALLVFIAIPIAMAALVAPRYAVMSVSTVLVPAALFFILWAICGTQKMYEATRTWFSGIIVALNLALVAAYIVFISLGAHINNPWYAEQPTPAAEIRITETLD